MRTLVLVIIPLSILGCRSMEGLREDRRASARGTEEVYTASFETLWAKSKDVLRESGAEGIEEVLQAKELYAAFPPSFLSHGTISCVYFEPEGSSWRVGAISRRRMPTNLVTSMTESGFHEALKAKLKP